MTIMEVHLTTVKVDLQRGGGGERKRQEENKHKAVLKHCQQSMHTLLLSSISALFPTSILLTLSEACCSMLRIQFLISEIIRS
jgi:hypothetical protein